ncbi:MgtC/SapB family protein [Psychromarinibacter sp. C21-152]|uniref:Protein MgtC n=1 Tax=Psychromarinibacter sediminicola TaxID=3033385 RepID=A0AAE3NS78_9RHOB|nr:MgtC/SapB family protein [Psychromarinibacter sediminicola]MDF0599985.1 MgtC/SapB family protein [Psychromarinibacter sediminicola]
MVEAIWNELSGSFSTVSWQVSGLRLVAALLLAGAVGLEREIRHKPAGLRTHMLVSLAACLFILVAQQLASLPFGAGDANDALRIDPLRLIEAVTAGVAFLAAGIIFTSGGKVHHVTTGASMWLAGAIGLACGSGQVPLAGLATAITIGVLFLVRVFEKGIGTR